MLHPGQGLTPDHPVAPKMLQPSRWDLMYGVESVQGGLSKPYPGPHVVVVLLRHEQCGCRRGKELCHDTCHHRRAAGAWKAENWTSLIPKL